MTTFPITTIVLLERQRIKCVSRCERLSRAALLLAHLGDLGFPVHVFAVDDATRPEKVEGHGGGGNYAEVLELFTGVAAVVFFGGACGGGVGAVLGLGLGLGLAAVAA
jgi:hypothetical protein